MNRNQVQPLLLLLAAAALPGPLSAQTRSQEPPKEPAKVERVKQPPKQAAPAGEVRKPEAPKMDAPKADSPNAEKREIAKKAAHFESVHRDRIARIDRLIAIYTAKGDRAKVTELEALRESQMKRHDNAMEGFRKQIGSDDWGRFEKEIKGPGERAQKVREKQEKPARPAGKN